MNHKSKIYVAGHKGLVGSAIIKELKKKGFKKVITATRDQLDLTDQKKVLKFLKQKKPDFIFIAAAKVGGIAANNKFKAQFIYENLQIQNNIIHSAHLTKVKNWKEAQCRSCRFTIKQPTVGATSSRMRLIRFVR